MRGAEVDCLRISVRAVRSHKPSRKATVGPVAPSHLAPCLTRWRREGWHRLGHAVYHLGIRAGLALRQHLLYQLDGLLDLLVAHSLDAPRMFNFHIPRAQQCQQLAVSCRLVLAHLGNRLRTAVPKVSEQGRNKLPVQLLAVTRADQRRWQRDWSRSRLRNQGSAQWPIFFLFFQVLRSITMQPE
jgi:hypothetical protein